jgi:hypothetical protein
MIFWGLRPLCRASHFLAVAATLRVRLSPHTFIAASGYFGTAASRQPFASLALARFAREARKREG